MAHKKLIIHAVNIHHGGGKILLSALLKYLSHDWQVELNVDSRFIIDPLILYPHLVINKIAPNIFQRLRAEFFLKKQAGVNDTILFFGNLPPLLSILGHKILFIQNAYLVIPQLPRMENMLRRFRLLIERWWLRLTVKHVDEIIVQTHTMEQHVNRCFPSKKTAIKSFFDFNSIPTSVSNITENYQFICVGDYIEHRNLDRVVAAWEILSREKIPAELLIVSNNAFIQKYSNNLPDGIKTLENLDRVSLLTIMRNCQVLIFPSFFESLSNVLIEAKALGLKIIAAEKDYLREVVIPEQTFDPESAISLANAVKRYLGIAPKMVTIHHPQDFLKELIH